MSKWRKFLSFIALMPMLSFSFLFLTVPAQALDCVYPGQAVLDSVINSPSDGEVSVTEIVACGGDDSSYEVPLVASVLFDGQVFDRVFVTTNSVITFGNPDGTYWDYPQTPSISLYSMDWVIYPEWRQDEHLVIRSSNGGFQVDLSARPIWLQNATEPTRITITAAINVDGTVAMSYTVDGPIYDDMTRTGVRLINGSIVTLEQYGVIEVDTPPELTPEPIDPIITRELVSEVVECSWYNQYTRRYVNGSADRQYYLYSDSRVEDITTAEQACSSAQPIFEPITYPQNAIFITSDEGGILQYTAPAGMKIDRILFASYGTPDNYQYGQCHSESSLDVVSGIVSNDSIVIESNNQIFGDPCPGTYKHLSIVVLIEEDPTYIPPPTIEERVISCSWTNPYNGETLLGEAVQRYYQYADGTQEDIESEGDVCQANSPIFQEPEPNILERIISCQFENPYTREVVYVDGIQRYYLYWNGATQDLESFEQVCLSIAPIFQEPEPTPEPTPTPTVEPTPEPTPTVEPTIEPTPEPTVEPTPTPTEEPTMEPTPEPTVEPTPEPEPTPQPEEPTSVDELLENLEEGESVSAEQLAELGIDYSELPPDTPVQLENGVILTAEVADALEIFENPSEILGAVFSDPGKALTAIANIGADMTPEKRKESQKVVVAAVIAGQVLSTASIVGRMK